MFRQAAGICRNRDPRQETAAQISLFVLLIGAATRNLSELHRLPHLVPAVH
jgi:hypothetical protein